RKKIGNERRRVANLRRNLYAELIGIEPPDRCVDDRSAGEPIGSDVRTGPPILRPGDPAAEAAPAKIRIVIFMQVEVSAPAKRARREVTSILHPGGELQFIEHDEVV